MERQEKGAGGKDLKGIAHRQSLPSARTEQEQKSEMTMWPSIMFL